MRAVNINEIIDNSKFNRFHLALLISCFFIIVIDGYDMFMLGTILPTLMKEWHITPLVAGSISSYALIGMMFGALVFGPVADKIGRKNVILICYLIFTIFTFTSGFAHGVTAFSVQRFLAGLGLGGIMPNLIALVTEYAPKKMRSTLVSIMFSGHAFGGVVAALAGLAIIPGYGWRAVVWLGIAPIIVLPIIYKVLPDSIQFYVLKNQKRKLNDIMNRLQHDIVFDEQTKIDHNDVEKTKHVGFPVKHLFKEHRALSTVMFWIAYFMCLLVMYGLSTWLPKIMQAAGYPVGSSLLFLVTLNLGAVAGAIGGGKLADLFGARKILITFFIFGFASLTLLSFNPSMVLLYVLIAIAGATTTGTQIIANSYVSQYYPMEVRSTGIGWALGIGRLGGIFGPALVGYIMNLQLAPQSNFIAFAIPCVIAAVAMFIVRAKYGNNVRSVS